MIFDDLTDDNFLMFAMKEYNDIQCTDIEEFYDDLKKIKYIKRLFNIYKNNGQLKERLILNHLIVFYNVFPIQAGTRILFFKIGNSFSSILSNSFLLLISSSIISELSSTRNFCLLFSRFRPQLRLSSVNISSSIFPVNITAYYYRLINFNEYFDLKLTQIF